MCAILLSVADIGCDHDPTIPIPEPARQEVLNALTPEAAAALDADGRFQLAPPRSTGRPQVSEQRAADLAVALARFNLILDGGRYREQRGGPISFERLFSCQRPLYAEAPFDRLVIDTVEKPAHPLQKGTGPFWLVKLCGPDGPELNVAVSAYSTELSITPAGRVEFPAIGGGDFFAQGIPALRSHDDLPSAEAAAVLAATVSNRRVAMVPTLILPFFRDGAPTDARWRLLLDGLVRMRTATGGVLETRELYVSRIREGNGSRFWVADATQPDFKEVVFVPLTFVGEKFDDYLKREIAEMRTLHAIRLPDVPIAFTAATIDR